MTVLVIKFKELFLPNGKGFLETSRGFYLSRENIQNAPSVFTWVSHIGSIERIFRVYFPMNLKLTVWVINFKIGSCGARGESEQTKTWVLKGKSLVTTTSLIFHTTITRWYMQEEILNLFFSNPRHISVLSKSWQICHVSVC